MLNHLLYLICYTLPSRKHGKHSCPLRAETILGANTVYICKPHSCTWKLCLFILTNANPMLSLSLITCVLQDSLWPIIFKHESPCISLIVLDIHVTQQAKRMHIKIFVLHICKSFSRTILYIVQHSRKRKTFFYHIQSVLP